MQIHQLNEIARHNSGNIWLQILRNIQLDQIKLLEIAIKRHIHTALHNWYWNFPVYRNITKNAENKVHESKKKHVQ